MSRVIGVIPARLDSKRFPAKALAPLKGKPLLFYVWNQTRKSKALDRVIIATDSVEIKEAARNFGAEIVMTSKHLLNGSERVAEVAKQVAGDIFVNVQGDFLRFNLNWINEGVAALRADRKLQFLTLITRIREDKELFDPDRVKVVVRGNPPSEALWFSRYPLPFVRSDSNSNSYRENICRENKFWKHLGIYFYRRSGLKLYQSWSAGIYEKAESLEQLRILENGKRIGAIVVKGKSICIDSPEDLKIASNSG
jgi:3-deoxy-manno-octulosonate cytidylyltransferase (CMP-KDO synthetase)